jgi:hypothetical protein
MKEHLVPNTRKRHSFYSRAEFLGFGLLALIFLVVNSCGPKAIDKLSDAQICLDTANASQVDDCLSKIDGMESTAAYSLRCAGAFIKEGFLDPNVFIDSLSSITSGGVTASTFTQAMSLITFNNSSSISTNNTNAASAFNNCFLSGGKATTFLASFGYFSTALALYGSLNGVTYDNAESSSAFAAKLTTALATAVLDTADATPGKSNLKAALGSIVLSTYQISCSGSKKIDTTTCAKFESAVTTPTVSSNPEVVGGRFLTNL